MAPDVFTAELQKMLREELHTAQGLNRELAKVLWALRDELSLWREVAKPRLVTPPRQHVMVPNGTRTIVRYA